MFSSIGLKVRCSVYGESHGKGIGCVLEGLPAGEVIDFDEIMLQMERRAPGRDKTSTTRLESDVPEILSGVLDYEGGENVADFETESEKGVKFITTGAPLAIVIKNENTRSGDYGNIQNIPRPGHADYSGFVRYDGFNDIRGGGHFSGRLTAPLVFAGAVCKQILRRRGISVGGHIFEISGVYDQPINPISVTEDELEALSSTPFSLIDKKIERKMRDEVEKARLNADSVGGQVEVAVVGLKAGIGSPMFRSVEGRIAAAIFGVPAVKGIEFGVGFAASKMLGSECNDPMRVEEDDNGNKSVVATSNNNGGIIGGITNGMPVVFRVVVKPTSSIGQRQNSVNLDNMTNEKLIIKGRHDPCIVPRALPVIEAVTALALLDIIETELKF